MYENEPIAVIDFARMESGKSSASSQDGQDGQDGQIIITQSSHGKVGLLVDGLGDIPEVAESRIQPIPGALVAEGSAIADSIVRLSHDDAEPEILVIVSLERVVARAMGETV
jgi:chemotaxis signal transduction protein